MLRRLGATTFLLVCVVGGARGWARPPASPVASRGPWLLGGGHREPKPEPRPGYLGVVLQELDAREMAALHVKGNHGVVVWSVDRDAPAAAAGVRPQDVLLSINNKKVESLEAARKLLKNDTVGAVLALRLSRGGAEQTVVVQLADAEEIAREADAHMVSPGEAPATGDEVAMTPVAGGGAPAAGGHSQSFTRIFPLNALYTGVDVEELSSQLAEYFGVHDGAGLLVRTVNQNSPGSAAGLRAGDVILRVNGEPVVSHMDWVKQLHANRGRSVQLSVMRKGKEQGMPFTPGLERK